MIFKICMNKKAIIACVLFCTLSGGFFAGCVPKISHEPIVPGQRVALSYTCTLENGEIVSTTDTDTIHKLQEDPFSVFIGPGSMGNVVIQAGQDSLSGSRNSQDKLRDFQAVLKNEIGKRVVGTDPGKTLRLSLVAQDTPELSTDERFIRMAKRLFRPKKKTLSLSSFSGEGTEGTPTVGKDMTRSVEPWLKGEVTGMDETSVTVMYSANVGETVETLYGLALVSENETQYIIDIDVPAGKLVRAGGFIGRIVTTDEDTFTIDFGNAFGGEEISCEVTAEAVPDEKIGDISGDRTTVAASGMAEREAYGEHAVATVMYEGGTAGLQQKIHGAKDRNTVDPDDVSAARAVNGDLVSFDYTLLTRDGVLVMTSRRSDYENEMIQKAGGFEENASFGPVQTVLGHNEIVPFIENALYGMKAGEKKELHLEAKDAYGEKDLEKIKTFPRIKSLPERIDMTREEFRKRFNVDPQTGRQIQIVPYFKSKVDLVDGDHVLIEHLVEDGTVVPADLGSTKIAIQDGRIVMTLLPNSGAVFEANGERGVMIGYDDETFVADFNPPHVGESFFLDVSVRSVVKKAEYEKEILWSKGLDDVFEDINIDHKPAVLILYAEWCGWSSKLITETLKDPRITSLSDRFLWLKVDTDKDRGIYEHYEQKSYPTIVLLNNNGEVYRKLEGYTDPEKLSKALSELI